MTKNPIEPGETRIFTTDWKALRVKGCMITIKRKEADTVIVEFIAVPDELVDYDKPRRWSIDYLRQCSVPVYPELTYGDDPFLHYV